MRTISYYSDGGISIDSKTDSSQLDFGNLGFVHVDYIEMKRMFKRIQAINIDMVSCLGQLLGSLSELASLVDYSLKIDDMNMSSIGLESNFSWVEEDDFSNMSEVDSTGSSYVLGLSDNISNVLKIMDNQLMLYQEQAQITEEQLIQLNNMVNQVIDNPHLVVYDSEKGENVDILYNDLLRKYKREELLNDFGIADLDNLILKSNNSNCVNIYDYIEKNLKNEMSILGVSSGKEYLRTILDEAEKNALNNRDKAVCAAIAYNKFLGDNNISSLYDYGSGHAYFSVDDLATGTDCSSFVSIFIKEGNPNFAGGSTGSFLSDVQNISSVNIDNILPGDVLTSNSHARFVIAVDTERNVIITTENLNPSDGSVVREYSINDLINTGYVTYHVNYDN